MPAGSSASPSSCGVELLYGELFYTLHEAQVLLERRRRQYNMQRPHSALGYRPPAPETRMVTPIGLSA